jgi:hypothetical protein
MAMRKNGEMSGKRFSPNGLIPSLPQEQGIELSQMQIASEIASDAWRGKVGII